MTLEDSESRYATSLHSREVLILLGVWLALSAATLWLGRLNTAVPGPFYDETVFAGMAKDFVTGNTHGAHMAGNVTVEILGRPFPVFVQAYLGAVKSWLLIPAFQVFGPSLPVLRLTSVAWNLVGLLFFMLWTRRMAGLWIAGIAGVLLALDPTFFFLGFLDWGSAVPALLCRFMGFFFAVVAWQRGKERYAFLAGIIFGLGFFNKVDFGIILIGTLLAAACAYAQPLVSFVRSRPTIIILAGLGFLIAAAPMIMMLPGVLGFGLSRQFPSRAGQLSNKLHTMWTMYDGSYFYRMIAAGGRFGEMYKKPAPVWTPFGAVVLVASLILVVNVIYHRPGIERRLQIFLLLACGFITVGVLLLPGAVRIHHSTLVFPFPHLIIAVAAVSLWRQVSSLKGRTSLARGFLAVAFAALVLWQTLAISKTQQLIRETGGRGWWSNALAKFAEQVKGQSDLTIVSLDWGFNEQLLFLTDKPQLEEPVGKMRGFELSSLPKDPNHIYLVHSSEYTWFPIGPAFLKSVALTDKHTIIQTWKDGQGRDVFYSIRFTE